LDKGTKSAKKKKDGQNDFGLFGHQICLGTMQLGGKRQIILPINSEGISHTKRGENFRERRLQKKTKLKDKKNSLQLTHTHTTQKHPNPFSFYFSRTYKYPLKIKAEERKNIEKHIVKRRWYEGSRA